MAQPTTANHTNYNYFLHSGAGDSNYFNLVFHIREIPQSDHHMKMSAARQAIFAFTVTVFLNLVQIKYQGKLQSPFETRPKTMFLAIASLLLYHSVSSYYVKLRSRRAPVSASLNYFGKMSLGVLGPLSLASVISLLLPQSFCRLVFSLSALFSLARLLPPSHFETIWELLTKAAIYIMQKFPAQPSSHHALSTGGRRRLQVQLPWSPQPTNSLRNRV